MSNKRVIKIVSTASEQGFEEWEKESVRNNIDAVSNKDLVEIIREQIEKDVSDIIIDLSDAVNSISINGVLLDVVNRNVEIPIATQDNFGVVVGSEEIGISDQGALIIGQINLNKLVQDDGDRLVLICGNSIN